MHDRYSRDPIYLGSRPIAIKDHRESLDTRYVTRVSSRFTSAIFLPSFRDFPKNGDDGRSRGDKVVQNGSKIRSRNSYPFVQDQYFMVFNISSFGCGNRERDSNWFEKLEHSSSK